MPVHITGIIGEPLSAYSYAVITGWTIITALYWYIIFRFYTRGVAVRPYSLIAILSLEIIFLGLFLGLIGIFLFIILMFSTSSFLKRGVGNTRG